MSPCEFGKLKEQQQLKQRADVRATPNVGCPACGESRRHTAEEFAAFHPDAGKGHVKGQGV